MDWFIIARCNLCNAEKTFELDSDTPPYEL